MQFSFIWAKVPYTYLGVVCAYVFYVGKDISKSHARIFSPIADKIRIYIPEYS